MRDGVLDDQRLHPLGVGERQAEPDRAAVVLQVQAVVDDPLQLQESIERVAERLRLGRVAASEARVIGCDQTESVRQARDEVAEHDR